MVDLVSTRGFVLAGGRSTRMGRDKALMNWKGRTLVEHMVTLLSSAAERVQVVGRDPFPDRIPDCGPLGGIATALEASDSDSNLVVAIDLPLLTVDFLKYLRLRLESSPRTVVACRAGGRFPLCLGLRRSALSEVNRALESGGRSVREFILASDAEIIASERLSEEGFDVSMFRNLNTPEDWKMGT